MTTVPSAYRRKLSSDEAATARLLIEKTAWKRLPAPGSAFALTAGGETVTVRIEAEACSCRLPPHEHRWLDLAPFRERLGLRRGLVLTLDRLDEGAYRLLPSGA